MIPQRPAATTCCCCHHDPTRVQLVSRRSRPSQLLHCDGKGCFQRISMLPPRPRQQFRRRPPPRLLPCGCGCCCCCCSIFLAVVRLQIVTGDHRRQVMIRPTRNTSPLVSHPQRGRRFGCGSRRTTRAAAPRCGAIWNGSVDLGSSLSSSSREGISAASVAALSGI